MEVFQIFQSRFIITNILRGLLLLKKGQSCFLNGYITVYYYLLIIKNSYVQKIVSRSHVAVCGVVDVRPQRLAAQPRSRYPCAHSGSVSFAVNVRSADITTATFEQSFASAFPQLPGVAFSTCALTQPCSPSTSTRPL